jgi:hypothetical protein
VTGWKVILEGDGERPPSELTDEVPSTFLAVPNVGDHIVGPFARFIVTCVAHCEETPDVPEHVRKQLEGLAGQAQPFPTGMIEGQVRVGMTALAAVARAQLKPRPMCKIYVVKGPTR